MTVRPLALVTGGWRRIGGAIARKLAGEGWDLALHAHRASTFDNEFKAQLEWLGASVHPVSGDLEDPAYPPSLLAEVTDLAGRSRTFSSTVPRCSTMTAPTPSLLKRSSSISE